MALVEDTWLLTLHVRRVKMKEYKLNLDLVNLSAQNPLPTWFELYIPGKWNLKEDVIELKEELALDSSEYVTVLNKSCPAADLSTIIIPFRILVKLEKQSVGSVSWRVLLLNISVLASFLALILVIYLLLFVQRTDPSFRHVCTNFLLSFPFFAEEYVSHVLFIISDKYLLDVAYRS